MGFGTSYSLVHVDCMKWVHTSLPLRLLRGILGCCIAEGFYILFQLVPSSDNPTRFFFHYALPALFISFFIYGVFPIICLKLKLVESDDAPAQFLLSSEVEPNKNKSMMKSIAEETMEESMTKS